MSHRFHLNQQNRQTSKEAPDFEHEIAAFSEGFRYICGIDEAGRGALAGPLVAGAVILPKNCKPIFQDSKLLSSSGREELFRFIQENATAWSAGIIEIDQINTHGIQSATYLAYHQAIENIGRPVDFLLIDHYRLPGTMIKQKSITHGDRISQSIAAASIVAKVTRDHIMQDLHCNQEFALYGFNDNFGYGTKSHREAICKHGLSKLHRTAFVKDKSKNIPLFAE